MKSKLFYLLLIPLLSFAFQSCNKDEKDSYAEWREANEVFIEEIRNNSGYRAISIPQGSGTVYCKVLRESNGGESPIYTSKVKVYYKGSLINGAVFDDSSNRIAEFNVNEVVKGFGIALQNMREGDRQSEDERVGDKWEVVIPWQLGYGASASGSTIPPYSALIFEIELVEITQF